jgi:hypothetical protein
MKTEVQTIVKLSPELNGYIDSYLTQLRTAYNEKITKAELLSRLIEAGLLFDSLKTKY